MSAFIDANAANSTPPSQQAEQRTVVETAPTTLDYIVNGKRAHISNQQYECYEHIWRQLPHPVLGTIDVEEDVAASTVKRSGLSDEDLYDLWDLALSAQVSSLGCPDYREGFLSKVEFYVLLSELQDKISIPAEQLAAKLGYKPARPNRRNPFAKTRQTDDIPLPSPKVPINSTIQAPSMANVYDEKEVVQGLDTSSFVVVPKPTENSVRNLPIPIPLEVPEKTPVLSESDMAYLESIGNKAKAEESLLQEQTALIDLDSENNAPVPLRLGSSDRATQFRRQPISDDLSRLHPDISESTFAEATISDSAHSLRETGSRGDSASNHSASADSPRTGRSHSSTQPENAHELYSSLTTAESDQRAILLLERLKAEIDNGGRKAKYPTDKFRLSVSLGVNPLKKFRKETTVTRYPEPLAAEALEEAAAQGNVPLMASLMKYGADVKYASTVKKLPHDAIQRAAIRGHSLAVNFLASQGVLHEHLEYALYHACHHAHVDIAISLIENYGANIYLDHLSKRRMNCPKSKGLQCLASVDYMSYSCFEAMGFIANKSDRSRLLDFFLRQKSFQLDKNVSKRYTNVPQGDVDCAKLTALGVFTSMRWTEGVTRLLEAGANCDVGAIYTDDDSSLFSGYRRLVTPLCCLGNTDWVDRPEESFAIARLLLNHGAPANVDNHNFLLTWAKQPIFHPIRLGNLAATKLFLKYGADANATCYVQGLEASSLLQLATHYGHLEIVRGLIDAGAEVCKGQHPPLWIACDLGHEAIVTELLRLQAHKTGDGAEDCLKVAVKRIRLPIAQLLLDAGLEPTSGVLSVALTIETNRQRQYGYIELLDLLIIYGAKLQGVHILTAIEADNYIGLERVMDRAAERGTLRADIHPKIDRQDLLSRTYLSHARSLGKNNFVRLLQRHGFQGS